MQNENLQMRPLMAEMGLDRKKLNAVIRALLNLAVEKTTQNFLDQEQLTQHVEVAAGSPSVIVTSWAGSLRDRRKDVDTIHQMGRSAPSVGTELLCTGLRSWRDGEFSRVEKDLAILAG
jgi:hypothetical protein